MVAEVIYWSSLGGGVPAREQTKNFLKASTDRGGRLPHPAGRKNLLTNIKIAGRSAALQFRFRAHRSLPVINFFGEALSPLTNLAPSKESCFWQPIMGGGFILPSFMAAWASGRATEPQPNIMTATAEVLLRRLEDGGGVVGTLLFLFFCSWEGAPFLKYWNHRTLESARFSFSIILCFPPSPYGHPPPCVVCPTLRPYANTPRTVYSAILQLERGGGGGGRRRRSYLSCSSYRPHRDGFLRLRHGRRRSGLLLLTNESDEVESPQNAPPPLRLSADRRLPWRLRSSAWAPAPAFFPEVIWFRFFGFCLLFLPPFCVVVLF